MAGCILIVDAIATNRIILKVKLSAACYRVIQAADAVTAMRLAQTEAPDLVLLDHAPELCARLRTDPATAAIPLLVTTPTDDAAARAAAFAAGADAVLARPVDEPMLLARIRSLLRAAARRRELHPGEAGAALGLAEPPGPAFEMPARIAVVAHEAHRALGWSRIIDRLGQHACTVFETGRALEALDRGLPPDLILIDPGPGGAARALRLVSDLQSRRDTRGAAFLMVADPMDPSASVTALDLGLDDLIEPGVPPRELGLRLGRQLTRKRENDRLREALGDGMRLAATDPLTGLHNRRYALRRLHQIAEAARLSGAPFAVLVLDLDRFKQVNDRYGHAAGDAVLQVVAERMRRAVRKDDVLARIGGEEFLVVLPETDLPRARRRAERLRRAVGGTPVVLQRRGDAIRVTMSIGLAIGGADDAAADTPNRTVEQADRALYVAKSDGRNQVIVGRPAA